MLAASALAVADALDGRFEVRSAFVNLHDDVYHLSADVQYPSNQQMRVALADGVSLTFDLQVRIARERRYWFDNTLFHLTQRRRLEYHSVSDHYIVRDESNGTQRSFASFEAAIADLGKVESWPILTRAQLGRAAAYRIAVRASVQRGRLNDALRTIFFWTNDWQRTSEWYEWSLPR
ncbi:MAG: DUF4390 domain-containing protein [Steroidobacteraceae bacterium]|nr:DUF4390 domain-containing protein [Steroidobacteraceae bacterium]MDW8260800.1 DUF4390 domain-containing protein [Gammaproteobacteria bacterium]